MWYGAEVLRLLILLSLIISPAAALAQEMRGLWVDAFNTGYKSASEVTQLIADARAGNFNAIFVQVRKRGDAYYNSTVEPKASDVSPQSFDPLADLLQKAASGGPRIEIHAWIVTYNIWNSQAGTPSQPSHPYTRYPGWLTEKDDGTKWDGANYAFDQAVPEVQSHVFAICQDLLSRYAVDGLHFDYVRYSDSGSSTNSQPWGYHATAVRRFQSLTGRSDRPLPGDSQWLQFRRDQVSALVRKVYLNGWKTRRSARISAATISYGNAPADNSLAAWRSRDAYSRVLQDWQGWLGEGILDLAIPMIYRDCTIPDRKSEWEAWCAWARDNQGSRAAAAGWAPYLNTVEGSISEIKSARSVVAGRSLAGVVGYSYANWCRRLTSGTTYEANYTPRSQYLAALTTDTGAGAVFASPVAVSAMPWKQDATRGHLMGTAFSASGTSLDGASVSITGPVTRTVRTDATGFFGSVDLPAGTYTVVLNVAGYPPVTRVVTVAGAQVAETSMSLRVQPFEITSAAWNNSLRRMTLTWNSSPGRTYRVEVGGSLTVWTSLASSLPSGGVTTVWTSSTLPISSRRFFRVLEE